MDIIAALGALILLAVVVVIPYETVKWLAQKYEASRDRSMIAEFKRRRRDDPEDVTTETP